jgi:hypothetical protein
MKISVITEEKNRLRISFMFRNAVRKEKFPVLSGKNSVLHYSYRRATIGSTRVVRTLTPLSKELPRGTGAPQKKIEGTGNKMGLCCVSSIAFP